jgi:hypothetical protein
LSGEVSKDADYEWQFLDFNRVAGLDIVSNLNAGRAHPVQFVLCARFCHVVSLTTLRIFEEVQYPDSTNSGFAVDLGIVTVGGNTLV